MYGGASGRGGIACDLTAAIDANSIAVWSTQRSQVNDVIRSWCGGRCISNPGACYERGQQDNAINGTILCHERVFHFWSAVIVKLA
jgi:hypothetical protein